MTGKVWMCKVEQKTEAFRSFAAGLKHEPRPDGLSTAEVNETNDSNFKGEPLPRSRFPEALFHLRPQKYAKSIPPVLNQIVFVSEATRRRFSGSTTWVMGRFIR